tara:strand:+ start:1492 stop:1647 length:156 start_codon:yes stop_codon:yes gene_type:complete
MLEKRRQRLGVISVRGWLGSWGFFCIAQLLSDQNFMETLLSPNKFVEIQKR